MPTIGTWACRAATLRWRRAMVLRRGFFEILFTGKAFCIGVARFHRLQLSPNPASRIVRAITRMLRAQ